MNDLINWIALNNTLLIRIGFSAVVLLLVVYVFRFFFMPSNSVASTDNSENSIDSTKGSASELNIEELSELQAEIDTLKVKLKEAEAATKVATVKIDSTKAAVTPASAALPSTGEADVDTVASSEPKSEVSNRGDTLELAEKVKNLEARLSEYEIIAEEIAEIGKLREENEHLKSKLTSTKEIDISSFEETQLDSDKETQLDSDKESEVIKVGEIKDPVSSIESESESESESELELESESELSQEDAAPKKDESAVVFDDESSIMIKGTKQQATESIFIQSEAVVTKEEKELIETFEEFNKKGSA
jgi:hypothetical protein